MTYQKTVMSLAHRIYRTAVTSWSLALAEAHRIVKERLARAVQFSSRSQLRVARVSANVTRFGV